MHGDAGMVGSARAFGGSLLLLVVLANFQIVGAFGFSLPTLTVQPPASRFWRGLDLSACRGLHRSGPACLQLQLHAADARASRRQSLVTFSVSFGTSISAVMHTPLPARASSAEQGRPRVLVAGATGRTGSEVVRALLHEGQYEPLLQVRNSAAKAKLSKSAELGRLQAFECDVTAPGAAATLTKIMREYRVQSVVCTLGFVPTFVPADDLLASRAIDNQGVIALIRAAEAAGLPGRFVLISSLLTSSKPESRNLSARMLNSLGGVLDAKYASEAVLMSSTLDYTILRPGVFADKVQGNIIAGMADRFTGAESDSLGLGGPVKCQSPFIASAGEVCGITRRQLAEVSIQVLRDSGSARTVLELVARPDADPLVAGESISLSASRRETRTR
jgi:NAD(P)-dependent dehydrogenase (short-subunit alcohol dehydrogenase family)